MEIKAVAIFHGYFSFTVVCAKGEIKEDPKERKKYYKQQISQGLGIGPGIINNTKANQYHHNNINYLV